MGCGAPGEHESSVAKLLFREFGGLQVIEFLISDFWVVLENNNGSLTQLSVEGLLLVRSLLASLYA